MSYVVFAIIAWCVASCAVGLAIGRVLRDLRKLDDDEEQAEIEWQAELRTNAAIVRCYEQRGEFREQ